MYSFFKLRSVLRYEQSFNESQGGCTLAKFGFNNIMQGVMGNMTEETKESLEKDYAPYLFSGEEIETGYKLLRDAIVFTNYRIIFVDRQGATGKKTSFKSIYLSHIVDVEMETAGSGFDDSEITITYMRNVRRTGRAEILETRKFEFPKQTDILPLYKMLGDLVITNRNAINDVSE